MCEWYVRDAEFGLGRCITAETAWAVAEQYLRLEGYPSNSFVVGQSSVSRYKHTFFFAKSDLDDGSTIDRWSLNIFNLSFLWEDGVWPEGYLYHPDIDS